VGDAVGLSGMAGAAGVWGGDVDGDNGRCGEGVMYGERDLD
jgi:hypothetical protein